MNQILDKLGIYDLLAILFSGISVLTISLLILELVYQIPISTDLNVNESLLYFVLSYFLGMLLQEIGWLIYAEHICKNRKLLKDVLSTDLDAIYSLTESEKDRLSAYVSGQLNMENVNENTIYEYCKSYVLQYCDMSRMDKDQSLSAMSRSFALYFFALTVIAAFSLLFQFTGARFGTCLASLLLAVLFHNRCLRFSRMRYSKILRTFYYCKQESIQSHIEAAGKQKERSVPNAEQSCVSGGTAGGSH